MANDIYKQKISEDTEWIYIFITDNFSAQQAPVSTEQLQQFATTIKRLRQTVLDWQLDASLDLNTNTQLDDSTEIQQHIQSFSTLCIEVVKNPAIFYENIQNIEDVFQIIFNVLNNEANLENESTPVEIPPEVKAEMKKYAMQTLFNLKELSTIVFAALYSSENNSHSFAQSAKSTFQQITTFNDFLTKVTFAFL